MCIYRFASKSSTSKVNEKSCIRVYLQSMGLVKGNHQEMLMHSWVITAFIKFTPTIGPLQRRHSSGRIWTTWPYLTGQNWMGQSGYLALGKSKHRIYSLYLYLVMSLSPFLSLTPEFSCRGLVIYMVIGANTYRSLRAVVIVFAILNRALRNTQKARDLQREQVLKEDKGTDMQRIWDHRVFGPNGRGRVGSRAWPCF